MLAQMAQTNKQTDLGAYLNDTVDALIYGAEGYSRKIEELGTGIQLVWKKAVHEKLTVIH